MAVEIAGSTNEPQRGYHWRLVIHPLSGSTAPIRSPAGLLTSITDSAKRRVKSEIQGVNLEEAVLSPFLVQNVSFPTRSFDSFTDNVKGQPVVTIKGSTALEISVTFYETQIGEVTAALEAWKERVFTKDGFVGLIGEYATNIQLDLYNGQHIVHTALVGEVCWPTATAPLDLGYDTSNLVLVTQSFACHRVTINNKGLADALKSLQRLPTDRDEIESMIGTGNALARRARGLFGG